MSRVKQSPKFNSSKRGIATAVEKVHRVNESIDVPEVRLIGEDGQQIGIMPTEQALEYAQREDFDLVEISPNAEPPVCRLLDYGKFLYNASKRRQDARRKQKHLVVKEIKFRPSTDVGDYEVKLNKLKDFLNSGNKTKVTMRFRGREFVHVDLGVDLLMRVKDDLAELATVEQEPSLEGRQMIMVLAPVKNPIKREVNATS